MINLTFKELNKPLKKNFSDYEKKLKQKLDYHYRFFDKSQLSPDPLEFPHRFGNFYDIEISAFISSTIAYGNIKQIENSLEKLHSVMGKSPYDFVMNFSNNEGEKLLKNFKHRFYTSNNILQLFKILKKVYIKYGSLNNLFFLHYSKEDKNIKNSLSFFSLSFYQLAEEKKIQTRILKFMFPDPLKGSACKRMNLFLRWMVRNDELDFGLWKNILPGKLIIPVDTHVAGICKELKLTTRKTVSWNMAEEITENLKKFDPFDPVKYDFAICHIGIRKKDFNLLL